MTTAKPSRPENPQPPDVKFPVDSYRDAAPQLRRPFMPEAVKFKVQTVLKSQDGKPYKALVVTYIDARLVVERLNYVCPHLWSEHEPKPLQGGKGLLYTLEIDGRIRYDVGEPGDTDASRSPKALVSDAFKRAAVKFGVGVSLYATPQIWINAGPWTRERRTKSGLTLELTDEGVGECRRRYQVWLDTVGREAFGGPLNHGDVADAAGDYEADARTAEESETAASGVPRGRGSDVTQPGDDPRQGPHTVEDAVRENAEQRVVEAATAKAAGNSTVREDVANVWDGEALLAAVGAYGLDMDAFRQACADAGVEPWQGPRKKTEKRDHLDALTAEQRVALGQSIVAVGTRRSAAGAES